MAVNVYEWSYVLEIFRKIVIVKSLNMLVLTSTIRSKKFRMSFLLISILGTIGSFEKIPHFG